MASRLLLHVKALGQYCRVGARVFDQVTGCCTVSGQTAALKFGGPRVTALCQAVLLFFLLPQGFCNASLCEHVARLNRSTNTIKQTPSNQFPNHN